MDNNTHGHAGRLFLKSPVLPSAGIVELDIHGLNKFQAKTLIDSRIKKAGRSVYRIRIIHGYHSGNELKNMVKSVYGGNNPKVIRIEYGLNPGETDLVLREFL